MIDRPKSGLVILDKLVSQCLVFSDNFHESQQAVSL